MAKGDNERARTQIDYQGGKAQNRLDNMWDMFIPQNQEFWNNFTRSSKDAEIEKQRLMEGFGEFQKTGGYSPTDLASMRNRGLSQVRSTYSNANREVDRQKALQGGYSPGYGVLKARMARDMSTGLSDSALNAEGNIAQMVNEGKRFGMSGASQLYGMAPGMASMYGNMLDSSNRNLIGMGQLQNNLGLGIMGNMIDVARTPGKWQTGFDNAMKLGDTAAGMWSAW